MVISNQRLGSLKMPTNTLSSSVGHRKRRNIFYMQTTKLIKLVRCLSHTRHSFYGSEAGDNSTPHANFSKMKIKVVWLYSNQRSIGMLVCCFRISWLLLFVTISSIFFGEQQNNIVEPYQNIDLRVISFRTKFNRACSK